MDEGVPMTHGNSHIQITIFAGIILTFAGKISKNIIQSRTKGSSITPEHTQNYKNLENMPQGEISPVRS